MVTTVTVLSRSDCHLCEEAVAAIERVAASIDTPVTIDEVDVDEHPPLAGAYGERVPYVLVDGRPAFKFRVDEGELRSHLRS